MILETDFFCIAVARSSEKIMDVCIFILGITKTREKLLRKNSKIQKISA